MRMAGEGGSQDTLARWEESLPWPLPEPTKGFAGS